MTKKRILVVDDERDLCEILQFNLTTQGYEVDIACSAEEALNKNIQSYSLFLLDVMMEEMSGFELLNILRNDRNIKAPVIFVTAMTSEQDLLRGFNLGADDYIKKPFSIQEVIARVTVLIERFNVNTQPENQEQIVRLNSNEKTLYIDKKPIEFTKTEYDIFTLLFTKPGKVYSREDIMNHIWSDHQNILGRTIDVNITRIRKKLGSWGKCIATRSGYGYYYNSKKVSLT